VAEDAQIEMSGEAHRILGREFFQQRPGFVLAIEELHQNSIVSNNFSIGWVQFQCPLIITCGLFPVIVAAFRP